MSLSYQKNAWLAQPYFGMTQTKELYFATFTDHDTL